MSIYFHILYGRNSTRAFILNISVQPLQPSVGVLKDPEYLLNSYTYHDLEDSTHN